MRCHRMISPVCLSVLMLAPVDSTIAQDEKGPAYPPTRRVDVVDLLHGEKIADPYRWLEDMESADTRRWVKQQDDLFRAYVGRAGVQSTLVKRIAAIGRFDTISMPVKGGDRFFFTKTEAGRSRGVLYVRTGLDGEPRVLIDPTVFFDDETNQLAGWVPSPDGRLLAFGVSKGQTVWRRLKIMDVDTGAVRDDELTGLVDTSSVHWSPDSRGMFYRRFDNPADEMSAKIEIDNPRFCFHRLGTRQAADEIIMAFPDRTDWLPGTGTLTRDGRYLIVEVRDKKSRTRRTFYKDTAARGAPPVQLVEDNERFRFLVNRGNELLFFTDRGAPRGRVVAIDIRDPEPSHWKELIPEAADRLVSVNACANRLFARYSQDARPLVKLFDLNGQYKGTLEIPGIGGVGFAGKTGQPEVFYRFANLFNPGTIYRLDLETARGSIFHRPELSFDPDDYELKQVFYKSKDGTRVPMFVAHKKGFERDGRSPLWMYGYGHGGWVAFPWFQAHLVAWMDLGGVYALPGIRGGGEYGAEWADAGMRRNKQNAIDDYIAAAEWLIENRYTSSAGLVANGGSASGVMPAAAINQRPELFGAAVIDMPFLDMLRYHKFSLGFTSGYGSPEDPEDFKVLRAYSPYHNLKSGICYPPMLISVAERDQSTAPLHGYKFIAALQAAQSCGRPVLMQQIWGAGHYTFGTTREQRNETLANQIVFLVRALGIEVADKTARTIKP